MVLVSSSIFFIMLISLSLISSEVPAVSMRDFILSRVTYA